MRFFLSALLFFAFSTLLAQSLPDHAIRATVTDETGRPIPIGNVLLRSMADSSLLSGAVFEEGQVLISAVRESQVLVNITALGYEDSWKTIRFDPKEPVLDLGAVVLTSSWLAEVEVRSQRSIYQANENGLTVNVAQTALANAGSLTDLLRNTPRLIADRAGGFSVLGKGNAIVYLDGQRVNSPGLLDQLSARDIAKIEILDNPPAKYEAAGNAVVSITSRGQSQDLYRIDLLQEAGVGKFFRSNFRAGGQYRMGRLSVNGTLGLRPRTLGNRFQQQRSYPDGLFIDNHYVLKSQRLDRQTDLRLAYALSPHQNLRLGYGGNLLSVENLGQNEREIYSPNESVFPISSRVSGPLRQKNDEYRLIYTQSADSSGTNLQFAAVHTRFGVNRNESIRQLIGPRSETELLRRSHNDNGIEVTTLQLDVDRQLSGRIKGAAGLKAAQITNESKVSLGEEGINGTFQLLPEFTNGYDFRENIFAAYAELNYKHEAWRATVGLRTEQTLTRGKSDGAQLFDRDYLNVFPSLTVGRGLANGHDLSFSYAYRVNRPQFQDLNPYVLYVDSLVSLRGNPGLLPEYSHQFGLNWKKGNWAVDLSFVHTDGKINQLFRSQNPERLDVIAFVKENLDYTRLYALTASRRITHPRFSAFVALGLFYDDHAVADLEQRLTNTRAGYYLRVAPTVSLPWKWQLNAIFQYTSSRVDGVYLDDPMSYLNLSLSRKFMSDRLTFTLWANDVYDDFRFTGTTSFNGGQMAYLSEGDWHYLKVVLSWNFGKSGRWSEGRLSREEVNRIQRN